MKHGFKQHCFFGGGGDALEGRQKLWFVVQHIWQRLYNLINLIDLLVWRFPSYHNLIGQSHSYPRNKDIN